MSFKTILLFIGFQSLFINCFAVSKTFQAINGNWSFASNWLPSGIPASGDDVTIPTGKTAVVTGNLSNPAIRSLIVIGFLDLRDNGKLGVDVFLYSASTGHIFADSNNDLLRIGSTTYVSTNINTISGSTGTPPTGLPVKLRTFSFEILNSEILLSWNTSYESNFKDFNIQKSQDRKSFETIGIILPNILSQYDFKDSNPKSGQSYYRLQINDMDGSISYSKIIAVKYNQEDINLAYPNPSQDKSIYLNIPIENTIIEVFSLNGKKIPYKLEESNDHIKIIIPDNFSNTLLYLYYKKEGRKFTEKIFFK
jgi:hypothetical protein